MRDENSSGNDSRQDRSHDRKSSFLLPANLRPNLLRRSSSHSSRSSRSSFHPRRRRASSRSSHSAKSVFSHGSHDAQISDKEASDDSIGETDDDVCFPPDESQGINLEQLNQLLEDDSTTPNDIGATQIKSPAELKIPFMPATFPPLRLPDSAVQDDRADARSKSSRSSVSTTERHRFSFFASKVDRTIHAPDLASLVDEGDSFASLFTAKNGIWWLDCEDPSDQELKVLSKAFGIHPLTTDDIRTEESREKFELFSRYYFVCFHTFGNNPQNKEYYLEPINTYILVFEDGVLSFHLTPVSHCRNVRRRMRQLRDYVELSSDWICYAIIDDITDSFAPIMHDVEAATDKIEDSVYTETSQDSSSPLEAIADTRKIAMSLMRLLTGKADVVRGYSKRCGEIWPQRKNADVALYLGDIQDHILTMSQNLAAYEKILSRSHTNYMSYLQMEFVNASNRMTSVLSKATLLGTILVPMNLITGMFGMNVQVPGQETTNLRWFFGILGFVIFMILTLFVGANFWLYRSTRPRQ